MTTGHLQPGAFRAILAGVTDLKRQLDRAGYDTKDVHVRIPTEVGEQAEREMLAMNPEHWEPFCGGITVFADGHLKQLDFYGNIQVGWRSNRRKIKAKPWQIIKAAASMPSKPQ